MKRIIALTVLTTAIALTGCKTTKTPADLCAPIARDMTEEVIKADSIVRAVDTSSIHASLFETCVAGATAADKGGDFESAFFPYRNTIESLKDSPKGFSAALTVANAFLAGYKANGGTVPAYKANH